MLGESLRSQPPETLWHRCLVWSGVILEEHTARLTSERCWTEEDAVTLTGAEQDLVVVLIAVVMCERITALGLDDVPHAVPLTAPCEDGMTAILRRAPYAALTAHPAPDGEGAAEHGILLAAATAADPDERLVWDRVRRASYTVVASGAEYIWTHRWDGPRHPAAQPFGAPWERAPAMADFLRSLQDRHQGVKLSFAYGVED